jgi:hypothetical protein
VKLNPVKAAFVDYLLDVFESVVDEQAHNVNESGYPVYDFYRVSGFYVSRAFGIKIEPEHVRAHIRRCRRVLVICQAANFYFDRHHSHRSPFLNPLKP